MRHSGAPDAERFLLLAIFLSRVGAHARVVATLLDVALAAQTKGAKLFSKGRKDESTLEFLVKEKKIASAFFVGLGIYFGKVTYFPYTVKDCALDHLKSHMTDRQTDTVLEACWEKYATSEMRKAREAYEKVLRKIESKDSSNRIEFYEQMWREREEEARRIAERDQEFWKNKRDEEFWRNYHNQEEARARVKESEEREKNRKREYELSTRGY